MSLCATTGVLDASRSAAAEAAPASIETTVERSDDQAIVFRVRFTEPEFSTFDLSGTSWRRVRIASTGLTSEIGWPEVPVYTALVGVPADAEVIAVTGEPLEAAGRPGAPIVPVPLPERPADGGTVPVPVVEPAWTDVDRALSPASWAALLDVSWWRNRRVAAVAVYPLRTRPGSESCDFAGGVRVRVQLGPARAPTGKDLPVAFGADPLDPAIDAQLVNGPQSRGWLRTERPRRSLRARAPYFGDFGQWFRIRIRDLTSRPYEPGIVRVTGAQLALAGAQLPISQPETIRLFGGDPFDLPDDPSTETFGSPPWMREVAAIVADGGDGQLDAGDYIDFYAPPIDGYADELDPSAPDSTFRSRQYTSERAFWLTWGGAPRAPLAIDDARPRSAQAEIVEAVTERLHVETNRHYDPGPRKLPDYPWEKWWWNAGYHRGNTSPRTLSFDVRGHAPGSVATFTALFWGKNANPFLCSLPFDHHLILTLNGQALPDQQWDGVEPHEATVTGDLIVEGRNTMTIFVDRTVDPSCSRRDEVYLASLEMRHQRELRWTGVDFLLRSPVRDGAFLYRVTSLPDLSAEVWDATDPYAAAPLAAVASGTTGDVTLEFERTEQAAVRHRYFVTHPSLRRSPVAIERDTPPAGPGYLRERASPVDYIIVYRDGFESAAADLADLRSQVLPGIEPGSPLWPPRVLSVRLSDVFDEFSWGMPDPAAIRNFFKFAYENYRDDPAVPRLRFAVLLGDADLDHRDFETAANEDYIPAWSERHEFWLYDAGWVASWPSDDFMGLFEAPFNDRFMEIAIGRVPAQTAAQARDMIEKIRSHAETPDRGDWQTVATLVADDLCQGTSLDGGFHYYWTHTRQAEDLAAALPPSIWVDRVYLVDYPDPVTGPYPCRGTIKTSARDALVSAINRGTWLVDYVGHGGETVLADERVLESSDVPSLQNQGRYHCFVTASCSVGKYDDVAEGLAETILKRRRAGSVTSYSAAAVASSGSNIELNIDLLTALFRGRVATPDSMRAFGEAAVIARGLNSDLSNSSKYNVLGDPATRLAWASHDVDLVLTTPHGRWAQEDGAFATTGDSSAEVATTGVAVDEPDLWRGDVVTLTGQVVDDAGNAIALDGVVAVSVYDSQELRHRDGPFAPVDYHMPGAPVYRGDVRVEGGAFTTRFVVPTGLRRGDRGSARIRCHVFGDGTQENAFGSVDTLEISEDVHPDTVLDDTEGPLITLDFGAPSTAVPASSTLSIELEDPHGIYITQLLDSRSVVLTFEEVDGFVVSTLDLSGEIRFGDGTSNPDAYQRASIQVPIPSTLDANRTYLVRVLASDNLGNRSSAEAEIFLVATAGAEVRRVFAYPNPTERETHFFIDATVAAEVTVKIHTVTGRQIRELEATLQPGEGRIRPLRWNLRDEEGDTVANGSYVYVIEVRPIGGGKVDRSQGTVAVLR